MKNNSPQHKQYLIDSITEMQAFCAKLEIKINETNNDMAHHQMRGIYSRKQENIAQFKAILQSQYNTAI